MLTILSAQINSTIGDFEGNYRAVRDTIRFATRSVPVNLVVFPELTLTGYPPNDLLLRKDFVDDQLAYLDMVRELTAEVRDVNILIGAVVKNTGVGKPLRNAAICFRNGEEVFRYYKQLLPTYNVFDEARYFEPGSEEQENSFLVNVGEETYRVGVLICEDCWNDEASTIAPIYSVNPVKNSFAAERAGLDVMVTINASPSHIGKYEARHKMYQTLSKKYNVPFVYVNSVGGQDALIFDGYSFCVNGDNFQTAKGFMESFDMFIIDGPAVNLTTVETFSKDEQVFKHLKLGIKDYIQKNKFKSVVIGSSGGIDSAVVLMLAKEAIGADNVFAVTMPSKYSSAGSIDDSVDLCANLGVKLYTRPIEKDVQLAIEEYEKAFGTKPKRLTIENIQARIRGRVLMEFSNDTGALVLSTGNKSETSVGFCTLYGDCNGGIAPIGDLYKMEVFSLAKWYNKDFCGDDIIPSDIINKAPSAELWEGQRDADSLPAYPILDSILKLYLERDLLTKAEIDKCMSDIEDISLREIKRILVLTDRAEFKRRQMPPILRVSRRSFGFGRNLPIAQNYKVGFHNIL